MKIGDAKVSLAVVTGGGTGGHVIPALAIREAFIKRGIDTVYIGSKNGIEARIVKDDMNSLFLNLRGVKGKGIGDAVKGVFLSLSAFLRLLCHFLKIKPTVVVGTGGFVCFPAVAAGFLCGSKIYLQEQNAVPGATIKLLSKFAKYVFLGFEDAGQFLPADKTIYSGNPLRRVFYEEKRGYTSHKIGEKMQILVLGGSQGANFINTIVTETVDLLKKDRFIFIHQAGEKNRESIEKIYKEKGVEAKVLGFSQDLHKYYFQSHLIISRAGAMTVSEIAASLRPSILIPFPHAIYDHQRKNALALEKIGAAKVFLEKEVTADILAAVITELYENPEQLINMSKNLTVLKYVDAAEFITEKILEDMKVV
ncbi:MAG: undecaprenyldiphospho-muramoylpentapeptide beta-N-acetylglucosaminyltransferase [bacterium]